jgi:hypothetical protein
MEPEEVKPWGWIGLGGWLAGGLFFAVWETIALRRNEDRYPTLTNVIKRYIPRWAQAMALGWLAWHFLHGDPGDR